MDGFGEFLMKLVSPKEFAKGTMIGVLKESLMDCQNLVSIFFFVLFIRFLIHVLYVVCPLIFFPIKSCIHTLDIVVSTTVVSFLTYWLLMWSNDFQSHFEFLFTTKQR